MLYISMYLFYIESESLLEEKQRQFTTNAFY